MKLFDTQFCVPTHFFISITLQLSYPVIIDLLKILEDLVHPLLTDVLLAGGSGEMVSLDVGQCQKSCNNAPSVIEPHVVDFGSAASKVSPSFMRHQHTPKLS